MTQGGTGSAEEVKPQERKSVGTGPDSTMGQEPQILSHTAPRKPPHLTILPRPLKVSAHLKPVSLPSEFLLLGTSATLQAWMPGTVRPLWSVLETSGNREPISSRSPLSTQQSQAQPGQMGWTVSPVCSPLFSPLLWAPAPVLRQILGTSRAQGSEGQISRLCHQPFI